MRFPSSTYRLQLRAEFTFEDAAAIVPYLRDLGIGDVYASPILASTSGSPHGYDGIDPTRLDGPRGGEDGFAALVAAAREHGLGMLVDIVPNHLATSEQNALVVGRAPARARVRARPRRSTSSGTRRASTASCCCPCSAARSPR